MLLLNEEVKLVNIYISNPISQRTWIAASGLLCLLGHLLPDGILML